MKKFEFIKPEQSMRVEAAMDKHRVTRLLTDYGALAFCYGLFLFLYDLPVLQDVIEGAHLALIGWAGLLTVYSIVVRRLWEKLPMWQPLVVFVVVGGITAVLNRQVGLVTNLKAWVLAMLPLAAFLPLCLSCEKSQREKKLLTAFSGGAAVMLVASAIAIVMYLLRISTAVAPFGNAHMVGLRYYIPDDPESGILLYGLYGDTNHAAAYAVVCMAYCVWVLHAHRRRVVGKGMQVFAIVNLAVQACYFPLANSRGGWLCLVVAGVACVFLYCFCTRFGEMKALKRFALSAVASVLVMAAVCGGLLALRGGLSMVSRAILYTPPAQVEGAVTDLIPQAPEAEAQWGQQSMDVFEKTDDGFGAGRLIIWQEALQLFGHKPILGTGPNNASFYAKLYDFGERLRDGFSLHNSFLDVLVYFGVAGFAALMTFFGYCVWLVLGRVFKAGKRLDGTTHLAAFSVVFLAGVSMFLSCAFINTTAMYFWMLCALSYLLAQCKDVKA